MIFQDTVTHRKIEIIKSMVRETQKVNELSIKMDENKVRIAMREKWCPPSKGWVKINMDGSFRHNTGNTTTGGLICDEKGCWLAGFVTNARQGNVEKAEFLANIRAWSLLGLKARGRWSLKAIAEW